MRYLKLFERIFSSDESRVKKMCEEYLIYLLDENFQLKFFTQPYDKINIHLTKKGVDKNVITFDWDDVKSDLIPLIEVLSQQTKNDDLKFRLTNDKGTKNYVTIMCNYENGKGAFGMTYDLNSILNDEIQNRHRLNIKDICFVVKKLKGGLWG